MKMNRFIYFFIASAIFCVDRLTKYLALLWLRDTSYTFTSFISFELVINRGISWGLFHSDSSNGFIFFSALIVFVTLIMCWHAYNLWRVDRLLVGSICVIAGSLSNIIDRIYYGGVIDFILFSYKNFSWPIFNIADVAIVCGVMIMLLQEEV